MKQRKADCRSERTYHLVSSALVERLLEQPYEAILVQDILDRAGIGRTTFYAHYFDKEDALSTLTEQMLETFTHQLARQHHDHASCQAWNCLNMSTTPSIGSFS